MVKVYAPASIGNVNVGFDLLGAALAPIDGTRLGDTVTAEVADRFSLHIGGRYQDALPQSLQQNIVWQSWVRFCKLLNKEIPVALTLEKNMPIGSGLGSSACSIVASVVALNQLCHQPLDTQALLTLMGELEGAISGSIHYDNVAPCFLGGLQFVLNEGALISQSLPFFDDWLWVVAYPGSTLSTAEARAILPNSYPRTTCIEQSRLFAGFVHACHTRQAALAANLMIDTLAEPWRAPLLPGYTAACQAVKTRGALTCGISGSGPTLFAICPDLAIAQSVEIWLSQHYLQNENGFVHICRLDKIGAKKVE